MWGTQMKRLLLKQTEKELDGLGAGIKKKMH